MSVGSTRRKTGGSPACSRNSKQHPKSENLALICLQFLLGLALLRPVLVTLLPILALTSYNYQTQLEPSAFVRKDS